MHAHVIGDLHGYYDAFEKLLLDSNLVDEQLNWKAGADQLWLIGDIFDRGQETVKCIELTMRLAEQAESQGGVVDCILGNHEVMFLAAHRFKDEPNLSEDIKQQWIRWGGFENDLASITGPQIAWLATRPAMKLLGNKLLVHSDNLSYVNFGLNVEQVNQYFQKLMKDDDVQHWLRILSPFSQKGGFESKLTGQQQAKQMLKLYGGDMIVHGHTPISQAIGIAAEEVTSARIYADGSCCNVDGGIYLGGPGFVYSFQIPEER